MHTCEFCGSLIPDYASFCGQCGRVSSKAMETQTMASDFHMPDVLDMDTDTIASGSGNFQTNSAYNQQTVISNTPTTLLSQEEEEEEERRRRAAILGMGVPLLGSLAVEGLPNAGNVPMVQDTPQIGGVPNVQGTPYPPAGSMGQGFYASPTVLAPQLPSSIPVSPLPATTTTLHQPHDPQHPHHPHTPHHNPHGCSMVFIIAAIMLPVLIILSFLGLGLTLFAPSLSLSGSASVVQGGNFTLHGNHFLPGSSVTLTLDYTIPLYYSSRSLPVQSVYTANSAMQILRMDTQQTKQLPLSNNIVSAGGDGTFAVTITAKPNWSLGEHIIQASEALTHRSADLNFTIYQAGTTPAPSTTGTASPTPSPSVNASPSPTTTLTPTATSTLPGLSCINPASLSLGPVSQGYNQPVSAQVTLCASGAGTVNWTATWDQNAAPWLHLDHTSGQISAPGQTLVNASALASNLAPGSYSLTLAFTSQPDNTTKSLQISFTVQGGCVSGNPNKLSFSGVANVSDPTAQAVTITNCGPTGAWSASTQTNNGGSWLFTSPTAGTLNARASSNVTITASNLKAQLAAGTYTGNVTFKIGTGTFTVHVTLTAMPAPTLSATPTTIFANRQCPLDQTGGNWLCSVSLTNSSNTLSLTWSATSSVNTININPSNGALPSGQANSVQFSIPRSDCSPSGKGTLTFTGPANTVTVEWYCYAR
jgi:Viral BACON domain